MLEIKGIFLLSDAQYEGYRHLIPQIDEPWWLQTSCRSMAVRTNGVAVVNPAGGCITSVLCSFDAPSVRPALILNDIMSVGGVFEFAGVEWTVVSSISKTSVAVCNTVIARRRFDPENNFWESSEIKSWLEEWLEYIVMGLDDVVYQP